MSGIDTRRFAVEDFLKPFDFLNRFEDELQADSAEQKRDT